MDKTVPDIDQNSKAVESTLSTAEILFVTIALMIVVCIILGAIYCHVQKINEMKSPTQRGFDPEVTVEVTVDVSDEDNDNRIVPSGLMQSKTKAFPKNETETGSIETKITPVLHKETKSGSNERIITPVLKNETESGSTERIITPVLNIETETGSFETKRMPVLGETDTKVAENSAASICRISGELWVIL